ncbi:MAG: DUF5615 family PIN-like protein [Blastocatellia bacterium]
MKLLFDQNLSWRLCNILADIFPDSDHIRNLGLQESEDIDIWKFAKSNGFVIVSKDADFQQRSLLFGHPSKIVWLRVGNCSVIAIEDLLIRHSISIHTFHLNTKKSYLVLSVND